MEGLPTASAKRVCDTQEIACTLPVVRSGPKELPRCISPPGVVRRNRPCSARVVGRPTSGKRQQQPRDELSVLSKEPAKPVPLKDVELLAQELRAEVKAECGALRQHLAEVAVKLLRALAKEREPEPEPKKDGLAAQLASISEAVHANSATCSEVLRRVGHAQVDLLKEVQKTGSQVSTGVAKLLQELGESSLGTEKLLRAVRAAKTEVLDRVMELKPEVDFVLTAVDDGAAALDFSKGMNHHTAREGRTGTNVAPILREVQQLRSQVTAVSRTLEMGSISVDGPQVVKSGKSEVLKTMRDQELRTGVNQVKADQSVFDLSPVLKEVQTLQSHVDTGISALQQSLRDGSVAAALSRAIKDEVKGHTPALDIQPVLAAINDSREALARRIQDIQRDTKPEAEGCIQGTKQQALEAVSEHGRPVVTATDCSNSIMLQQELQSMHSSLAVLVRGLERGSNAADLPPGAADTQPSLFHELLQVQSRVEHGFSVVLTTLEVLVQALQSMDAKLSDFAQAARSSESCS